MGKHHTLITGGSSGIGRSLAIECAKRGRNIIVTSRPGERLSATYKELSENYNVDVRYYPIDLTEPDAPSKLYEWCKSQQLEVKCLINNAGTTGTQPFETSTPEYLDSIVLLNIRALIQLTLCFIPDLKKIPGSKIINIGSMSGFVPVPYKGVYAASKAFVHSFTTSLAEELKETGIEVYLAAPNGVDSNPLVTERIKAHRLAGRLVSLPSDKFASMMLDRVDKGKRFFIPLFSNRLLFSLSLLIPDRTIARVLKKEFRKEFE